MMEQDLLDRERQASALAAAGMVAENVGRSLSSTSIGSLNHNQYHHQSGTPPPPRVSTPTGIMGGAMPVPPSLGHPPSVPAPQQQASAELVPSALQISHPASVAADNIGYGYTLMELGGELSAVTIDDMDLDFAKLFDPAAEAANFEVLRTEQPLVNMHQQAGSALAPAIGVEVAGGGGSMCQISLPAPGPLQAHATAPQPSMAPPVMPTVSPVPSQQTRISQMSTPVASSAPI